jgi:outer membrane protein OmpA-like peptidoglycan-associated protein
MRLGRRQLLAIANGTAHGAERPACRGAHESGLVLRHPRRYIRSGTATPKPKPKPARKVDQTIILDDVLFDFDRSNIKPEAAAILDRLIVFMNENKDKRVNLAGHTDNVGSEAYNQRLSERRVGSVRDYILKRGLPTTASPDKASAKANRLRIIRPAKDGRRTAGLKSTCNDSANLSEPTVHAVRTAG